MQDIERQVLKTLRNIDMQDLSPETRKIIQPLKRNITDARLDIREYEYSDTRGEQVKHSIVARKRLALVEKAILAATDVFTAVDTAQLLAELDRINKLLD